jgi:hypothetical protein
VKRLAVVAVGLVAVSACSSGPKQPAVSAFSAGTCRAAAPDVLQLGRDVGRLGKGPDVPRTRVDGLTSAQDRLDGIASAAEPSYAPSLRRLVTAVGIVRLRAHTGSYSPALGRDAMSAYDGVLAVCTRT